MITIGLTTWSEHQALIKEQNRSVTLREYAAHFPVVEVDTSFYGIPQKATILRWQQQVPPSFQFIIKANRLLTGHTETAPTLMQLKDHFKQFTAAIEPLVETHQLKSVLCQFPPFFTANKKNVAYLRFLRQQLEQLPLALELRNQSWYTAQTRNSLISFCQQQAYTLVAADEPTQEIGSVPFMPEVTTPSLLILRLHGRNQKGWFNPGKEWRKQRTLYRYNSAELTFFKHHIEALAGRVTEVCVIFNNNSGQDAAPNALELKRQLGIEFQGLGPLPPEQTELF